MHFSRVRLSVGPSAASLVILFCLLGTSGCGTTKEARTVAPSGFLGDYSQLRHGGGNLPLLVYGNPDADCRKYDKILIDPVMLWAQGSDSAFVNLDAQDRHILRSQANHALHDVAIHAGFQIVDRPGPGVIRLRAAITEAAKANVLLKDASIVAPYVGGAAVAWSEFKGQAAFTGDAAIEAELLDSLTGERLYAMVDKRVGDLDLRNYEEWDDVKESLAAWRDQATQRLLHCRNSGSFVPEAKEMSLEQQIESYRP